MSPNVLCSGEDKMQSFRLRNWCHSNICLNTNGYFFLIESSIYSHFFFLHNHTDINIIKQKLGRLWYLLSSFLLSQLHTHKKNTFQGSNLHPKSEKELHEALSSCEWQGNLKQRMLMYSLYHLRHAAKWLSFLHPRHMCSQSITRWGRNRQSIKAINLIGVTAT